MAGFEGIVGIQLFTANGKLVRTERRRVFGEDLELDVSTLPKGLYYLGLEKSGKKEMFKLIKE